jgi:hypothetical protein
MSRFYFDVVAGDNVISDDEGTELLSLESARSEAISDARYLMSQAILKGDDVSHKVVRVRGEDGQTVLSVPFAEAIRRPT